MIFCGGKINSYFRFSFRFSVKILGKLLILLAVNPLSIHQVNRMPGYVYGLILWLMLGMSCATKAPTPTTLPLSNTQDSLSYAVGVFLGDSYRDQQIDLDPDLIYQGLQDAMGQQPQQLSDSLAGQLIARLEAQTSRRQQERLARQAAENLASARSFLENNRRQDSIQELSSGLQYRILKAGTGASPTLDNEVRIAYRGHLLDGTELDRSDRHGGSVIIRVDEVIPGWSEAITRMKPGGRWRLFIPPKLAYGEQGRSPLVPPQSLLIFELELQEIVR
jgi:FKBP-type peptidyl-prolyl cis-trans isomerase FklB